jgi:predicted DNA-binding protein (MmcQ/YjbR family)
VTAASIRAFCLALPAAAYDLKWEVDHAYSVGGKMFAVVYDAKKGSESVSFKVEDGRFLELTDLPGVVPAPYLARAKWVQVKPLSSLRDSDMKALISRSHALVAAKLTQTVRRSIGLDAGAPKKPR